MSTRPYKILVLSRTYPNNMFEQLGLWVSHLVHHMTPHAEMKVISPIPYYPPIPGREEHVRFRDVKRYSFENEVETFYPRFFAGPGRSLYYTEAISYYLGIIILADKLQKRVGFDLIHAHFTYPDGVVAARLGQRYQVPVIITEHAPWTNWMDKSFIVRTQSVWAAERSLFQIAGSQFLKETISSFTKKPEIIRIIPNGVDENVFFPLEEDGGRASNQILFVGLIRFVKGLDLLIHSMRILIDRGQDVKLIVVGSGIFHRYKKDEIKVHQMVQDMGLENSIQFVGEKSPAEVADFMRKSTLLVLPSRVESFGAVLVEALACGIPVIATKCGGPEEIVHSKVGILVPKEDPDSLSLAIQDLITRKSHYSSEKVRAYALQHFSWKKIADQTFHLYKEAIDRFGGDVN